MNKIKAFEDFLRYLGVELIPFVASWFGGFVMIIRSKTNLNLKEKLYILSAAVLCGSYGTAFLSSFFSLKPGALGACGAAFGIAGMYIVGAILGIALKFQKDPIGTIKNIKTLSPDEKDTPVDQTP